MAESARLCDSASAAIARAESHDARRTLARRAGIESRIRFDSPEAFEFIALRRALSELEEVERTLTRALAETRREIAIRRIEADSLGRRLLETPSETGGAEGPPRP